MRKNMLLKSISFILVLALAIQSPLNIAYAINGDSTNENINGKHQEKSIEASMKHDKKTKELPQSKKIVTKKPNKIPPGLAKDEDKFNKWLNKKELVEKRTRNSKTYINEDGSKTAVVFLEPIHIKDSSGKYIDINNNLKAVNHSNSEGIYTNTTGIYDVYFSNENNNGSISVIKDDIKVQLVPTYTKGKEMVVEGSQVLYPGLKPTIDYLYTVNNTSIKEEIILYNYTDKNTFTYELVVDEKANVKLEQNTVNIMNKSTGESVYNISAPYMEDKEGNISENLKLDIEKKGKKYIINLTVDQKWLRDPARIYPVVIDPDIKVIANSDIKDTYVQSRIDTNHYNTSRLYIGYDDGERSGNKYFVDPNTGEIKDYHKEKTRAYIQFPLPPEITADSTINSATLELYAYTNWSQTPRIAKASRITRPWNVREIKWADNLSSSSPSSTETIDGAGSYTWDIKDIVNYWVNNGDNYGIELKMEDELNGHAEAFVSSDGSRSEKPKITITYTDEPDEPLPPPETGDFELVLERTGILENGQAYGKHTITWDGGQSEESENTNKATINYRLMPDNISGKIEEENFTELEWETNHYDLEQDKVYWIEADVLLEEWIQPEPIYDEEGNIIEEPEGYYEEKANEPLVTNKFIVYQVQPGDTLRRIAKHYLEDGNRYTEIMELNKLESEKLVVGQRLFIYTEKADPYNYKQPETLTTEQKKKEMTQGIFPKNTEMVGQYINSHTGAFTYGNMDFSFTSYNMPLSFIRSYDSTIENRKSPLGDSWDYGFNKYLIFYNDGTIGYNTGDGSRIYFEELAGRYTTSAPIYDELTDEGQYYQIKTNDNIKYRFNKDSGLLTTILDKNNNESTVFYDDNHWQRAIMDSTNRCIGIRYYESGEWIGNIKAVILPDTTTIEFSYESGSNKLKEFKDQNKHATTYSYDNNKLKTVRLPEGNTIITNVYDYRGRVIDQYDGENNHVNLTYQSNKTIYRDGEDKEYQYIYDYQKWLKQKIYPDSKYENYQYNLKGEISTFTDRMRRSHNYQYNNLGYVTRYEKPNGAYMKYEYKDGYLLKYIKDFEENEKRFSYDSNNNLDKVTEYLIEDGQERPIVTDYDYTAKGLLYKVTDPVKIKTNIDISGYPYKKVVKTNTNPGYTYHFDSMGRNITTIDANNNETKITYDNMGNVLTITYPSMDDTERYVSYVYDNNGNLESETSSRHIEELGGNPTTNYSYDHNDRLKTIIDPYNYTTTYKYDGNGNVDKHIDQEQNITTYTYNSINQLVGITNPGDTEQTVSYQYDDIGNIKRIDSIDGSWTSYDYNYDTNIVTITKPEGYEATNTFDDMGNVLIEGLQDGNAISYDYDELYRVTTIKNPGNMITKINYDDAGKIEVVEDPLGVKHVYKYNDDGRLEEIIEQSEDKFAQENTIQVAALILMATTSTNLVTNKISYTYDDNGNLKTVTDENGTTTYHYNELNKVSKIEDPAGKTKEFKYNEEGQLCTIIDGEKNVQEIKYDALGRQYKIEIPEESTTYTYLYDSRGNLEHYIDPLNNTTTYRYDEKGRLENILNAEQESITYQYEKGQLEKVLYPGGQYKEFDYDGLGRIKWYKDRAGVEHDIQYTLMNQTKYIKDSVGNETTYSYDNLSRLKEIKDSIGRTKIYNYNSFNQVESIIGADHNTTEYMYDSKGRVIQIIDPEDKITKINYDSQNRVNEVTKPGNRVYTYDYDSSGNLWKVKDPEENVTEYLYNDNNLVEEIIDPRNNSKTFTYNASNKVETVTDERGNTTTYDYYPGGLLKTVEDPKKNVTTYSYNDLNRLEAIENPLGETTSYTYDYWGNVETVTDGRGLTTAYTYTARDQIKTIEDHLGNVVTRQYYPNGDLWKIIDQERNETIYHYDEVHRLTKLEEPGGYIKNFQYDRITGDLVRVYDNAGQWTEYSYDIIHRLLAEADEQNHTISYTYDDFGNLKTRTVPGQGTTTYDYDELDRLTTIIDPQNQVTTMDYDGMGNIDYIKKSNGVLYDYEYDPANNLEKIVDSLGNETLYTYDANNNVETMIDPAGILYTYNYDALNRVSGVTSSIGEDSSYKYDASGNISKIIDGNNNTTYYHYNNLNRLEWVKDGEGNVTSYTYYKDGKLKTMTDPRQNTTQYSYNDAGDLTGIINEMGQTLSYEYNLLGDVEKIIKRDGNEIDYIYDDYNRLDKIVYPDLSEVDYEYDELNRVTTMIDKNGTTDYDYDDMGRLTYVSDKDGEEISYEYDEKGRKSRVVYPDGKYVTYHYDDFDRLIKVIGRNGEETSYTYDKQGRKKTVTYPNGITTTYDYDSKSRIDTMTSLDEQGNLVQKYKYQYDGAGNKEVEELWVEDKYYNREYDYYRNNTVKTMTEDEYTIDEITGQKEKIGQTVYVYHYDSFGNIDEKTVTKDGQTDIHTYTYNDINQMTSEYVNGKHKYTYEYDANGNRTKRILKSPEEIEAMKEQVREMLQEQGYEIVEEEEYTQLEEGQTLEKSQIILSKELENITTDYYYYDYENRLEEIVLHNGKVWTYNYDGEGNLIQRMHASYPLVKPPVTEGERLEDPAEFPGYNKNEDYDDGSDTDDESSKDKTNNGKEKPQKTSYITNQYDNIYTLASLTTIMLVKKDNDKEKPSKDNDKDDDEDDDKENGNSKTDKDNNGNDKNLDENGNGYAKGKEKGNNGKHLGWYKNGKIEELFKNGKYKPGYDMTNPEVWEVTNYINDINGDYTEVLMTRDKEDNYRAAYTYADGERISVEDLVKVEGKPNNPLYYLQDSLGSITAITNMNAEIIDTNRFAPYGEALDPVAKNTRLTNSPFGFTGEMHDVEADLVYLRARHYEPSTARFIQQDTYLGDIKEPLSRHLYIYGRNNPLTYVDPSGRSYVKDRFMGKIRWDMFWTNNEKESLGYLLEYDSFVDEYSVDGKLYRYELVPRTRFKSELRVGATLLPMLGDTAKWLFEHKMGYVGGISLTTEDEVVLDIIKSSAGALGSKVVKLFDNKLVFKIIEKIVGITDQLNSFVEESKEYEFYKIDEVAFTLMEEGGVSIYGNDIKELEDRINFVYSFMFLYPWYFVDDTIQGKALFLHDLEIKDMNIKEREEAINKIASYMKSKFYDKFIGDKIAHADTLRAINSFVDNFVASLFGKHGEASERNVEAFVEFFKLAYDEIYKENIDDRDYREIFVEVYGD